jgi:hypothetical protein
LDRIDDEHVEKSNIIEFAFTWAFVPSYPLFRIVQKKTSAFRSSSPFGCDGEGGAEARAEISSALDSATTDNAACKHIALIFKQHHNVLCRKETPTGHVFPKDSNGVITLADCLTRTNHNPAECSAAAPGLGHASSTADVVHRAVEPQDNDGQGQASPKSSSADRFLKVQLDSNVKCISFLKGSIEQQRRDFQNYVALFFLFLRFLCEAWSFITLILWFRGVYRTPRFGTIWFMSIAKHMMGTTGAALVLYYLVWHLMPSFIISSISYVFIYIIWPLGSLLLAYSLVMDGLRPATVAAISASSPRPKLPCQSHSTKSLNNSHNSDTITGNEPVQPRLRPRGGARAMSPVAVH